jgi:hypothetical protein
MTTWRKSSYSESQTPDCVELASLDGTVGIRDSKQPQMGHLTLKHSAFSLLVRRIKSGKLDR